MKKLLISLLFIGTLTNMTNAKMPAAANGKNKIPLTAVEMRGLGFAGQKFKQLQPGVWEVKNGVKIYSSETYGSKIWGYGGNTPVFIAVSAQGKIISIVAAPNMETPDYFAEVLDSKILQKWNGKTLKEAATYKPDIVSGATYSSLALIKTVNVTAKSIK